MCVCVCVFVCVCVHTCIHIEIYLYIYLYIYICMYIYICICFNSYDLYVYIHIQTSLYTYIHKYTYTCIFTIHYICMSSAHNISKIRTRNHTLCHAVVRMRVIYFRNKSTLARVQTPAESSEQPRQEWCAPRTRNATRSLAYVHKHER